MNVQAFRPSVWLVLSGLTAGILLGTAFAAAMGFSPAMGVAIAGGTCVLPVAMLFGVEWGLPFVVMAIVAFEEFPSGLGEVGEAAVERSTRTPFYSRSLGVSGLYAPDLLILSVLALLIFNGLLLRRLRFPKVDVVGFALMLLMGTTALSAVLSIFGGNPFAVVIPQDDSTVLFDLNQRALSLIAVFQEKNFFSLALGYVAGLLYLERRDRMDKLILAFLAGILLLVLAGTLRAVTHPGIITRADPLFYDSPSSWFFALVCFYTLLSWGYGLIGQRTTAALTALSGMLLIFILLSYRRTMWGGFAICGGAVFLMLPTAAKVRLFVVGGAGAGILGTMILVSPLGAALLQHVAGRVNETSIADLSTLYRVALFVHFFNERDNTPFFGFGVNPLWSQVISFGYLRFNLENIHSLYFWLWLRNGPFGFVCAVVAFLLLLGRAFWHFVSNRDKEDRTLAVCLLVAIFMFLFSGVFNPVYGEVRYMLPLGIMLAMLTRLGRFRLPRAEAGK